MFKIQNGTAAIPIPDYVQRQTTNSTKQYHPAKFRVMKANNDVYKYIPFLTGTISNQIFLMSLVLKASKQLFQMTLNLCNSVTVCVFSTYAITSL